MQRRPGNLYDCQDKCLRLKGPSSLFFHSVHVVSFPPAPNETLFHVHSFFSYVYKYTFFFRFYSSFKIKHLISVLHVEVAYVDIK